MAAIDPTQNHSEVAALLRTNPDKYVSLGDLLKYNKPDNRDLLIKTYGDQGITGFLQLTGAVRSAGQADEVQYWEEGRLHKTATVGIAETGTPDERCTLTFAAGKAARVNDVLLLPNGQRVIVLSSTVGVTMDGSTINTRSEEEVAIIGNVYAQGTGQPDQFYQTDVVKRTNPFLITKETFHVNGSQATNIGWINVGNGDYRWYVKGEMDTRKRFMNQREMMMLFSEKADTGSGVSGQADVNLDPAATDTADGIAGSEGYFQAVEDRGISTSGSFGDGAGFADVDEIIFELDKQGAPHEYAMYVDTKTSLNIDDMLASGIATQNTAGLAGQFGSFQNSPDMAVQLGFKSFSRGGYTFHKHGWGLMSDPTLLGLYNDSKPFKGAMVPMTQVADAKTGIKAPALEMNFKEAGGYSRELEHWVEGGGVLGFKTNGDDLAKFHYRSECNLITRAANQHVIFK